MSEKTDIRILKTKGKFRRALLDLLSVKSLNQISVCEICQKAGVNRNTFYAHYTSAEELMKETETAFTANLIDSIRIKGEYITSIKTLMDVVLNFAKNNRDMCVLLFSGTSSDLMTDILNEIYASATDTWCRAAGISVQDAGFLFNFISGGAVSVIRAWVGSGFAEDTGLVAERMTLMIEGAQERLASHCSMSHE